MGLWIAEGKYQGSRLGHGATTSLWGYRCGAGEMDCVEKVNKIGPGLSGLLNKCYDQDYCYASAPLASD